MSAAYFIVLEREIDGLGTMIDGKSLSRHIQSLDAAALTLGVRPLSEFLSMAPENLAGVIDGADAVELPSLQQFSAQDGLSTITALLPRPEAQPAVRDLQECERILSVAAQHGVGWHFEIDF
jgi:hypothetical protein